MRNTLFTPPPSRRNRHENVIHLSESRIVDMVSEAARRLERTGYVNEIRTRALVTRLLREMSDDSQDISQTHEVSALLRNIKNYPHLYQGDGSMLYLIYDLAMKASEAGYISYKRLRVIYETIEEARRFFKDNNKLQANRYYTHACMEILQGLRDNGLDERLFMEMVSLVHAEY